MPYNRYLINEEMCMKDVIFMVGTLLVIPPVIFAVAVTIVFLIGL